MDKIISNLALLSLLEHCKKNNIDCSGTHLYKYPLKWVYALIKDDTEKEICTVTFYMNRVPLFNNMETDKKLDKERVFLCPLCDAKTEYRKHDKKNGREDDNRFTHAWICTECPFIGFEYWDDSDLKGLKALIK